MRRPGAGPWHYQGDIMMKNAFRLAALAGVLALCLSTTLAKPAFAIVDCAGRNGSACFFPGSQGSCSTSDDRCMYFYSCSCVQNEEGGSVWWCGTFPTSQICSF